ncbi:N-acetylhexosamine 1-kinase [Polaribacter huanghezhanensis]|uniref:phosphotransferase enzyme family protein n=1 Tax=Polaribacter huanghezhanensis TaxID=1354726 RepID=UPI0026498808|nr:phosphotransferase [Polaribacter huanghezhanensis]WKD84727.1 N-acetylhexosamine 1-kinase [Polaribacter huanghezhanensis]
MENVLKSIINQFEIQSEFESFQELNSGHINDTFLIKTIQKPQYVLQKINNIVFKKAKKLIGNKIFVSNHLQQKLKYLPQKEIQQKVLCFVKAKDGTFFYEDANGNFWNASIFIEESVTFLKAENTQIAFEAGKITGEFLELTKDIDSAKITTILEDFHSVTVRYHQFKKALQHASEKKINQSKELIHFIEEHIEEMQEIDIAIQQNKLPLRVTHNDTKISNILFSKENKALCLIDTDTVMQGVLHFDYGDAIRTLCNTADEDEINTTKIGFNFEFFKSYTEGFFQTCKSATKQEINLLPISIKVLPFIMGMRFLTDYLNNDSYFKTTYQKHNLDRATNQFVFVKKITQQFFKIKEFIQAQ